MTIEHNEQFDLAYRFITETAENIFLTGKAGTGKTTFLKYLRENCTKTTIVAAPTGVAAINAGGVTLHSLFQLPFHPFIPTSSGKDELLKKMKYNKQRQQLLRKAELLIIDEISMVRCDVMDAIDTILRSIRRNYRVPFGGMQLLCIGDLYQLPPVAQSQEWNILQEYYSSPFFFDSLAVKEQKPLLIQLEKIYRQKEQSFVDLLNNVRINNMSAADFEMLHTRFIPAFRPAADEKFITLTSHNNQASLINNSEMQKLLTSAFLYEAGIENEFPENMFPADASLSLKEGAQVMFIKNDTVMKRYFNGKIGTVSALEKDKIIVDCAGEKIEVFRDTWDNSRYTLNRADGRLQQDVIGTFTQYPLRLAWAVTIHKSQGLTFDRVMIDAAAAFSSGQVYVALSRCTSLGGIILLSGIPPSAIQSNSTVDKGHQALSHSGSLAERFEGARQIFVQELLQDIFSFGNISAVFENLYHNLAAHRDRLNKNALEWAAGLQAKIASFTLTGQKFIRQAYTLMKDAPSIEANKALQDRIVAAAEHFKPLADSLLEEIKAHPLITEHKEAVDIIDEELLNTVNTLHAVSHTLEYCRQSFSVIGFLKHRLGYAQQKFSLTCYAGSRKASNTDSPNPELYDSLKRWRDAICAEQDLPIFMVVTHAGLRDICIFLPKTKRSLLLISGFGKVKVEKYGDDIIDTVIDYCERHGIEAGSENHPVKKEKKLRTPETKNLTATVSFSLFMEGKSISQISKERNLAMSTIEGHLVPYFLSGEANISSFMAVEKYESIMSVIKDRGEKKLSDLKALLPDATFGEIRIAEAAAKFKEGAGQHAVEGLPA